MKPIPKRPTQGIRYRFETLIGVTGVKMTKYRASWSDALLSPFDVLWKPHLFGALIFEVSEELLFATNKKANSVVQALVFGFGIGINVTNAVFLGSPPPVGFGYGPYAIAGFYGTPIVRSFLLSRRKGHSSLCLGQVAVIIGELVGRFMNDWIMEVGIRRNKGIFEAESRLWFVSSLGVSRASSLTHLAGRATLPCPSIYAALFFSEPRCKIIYRSVHW